MSERTQLAAPRVHSRGSGEPILLLHCLGVDHRIWDWLVQPLAGRFQTMSYDFPGHGESAVPGNAYGIEDLSLQLEAYVEREKISHAHVVGISLGGLVAQHFAATHPNLVDCLVLVDTTPRYSNALRRMWTQRAAAARIFGVQSFVDDLLGIWFTPEFVAADPPAVQYVRDSLASTSGEGYALGCEALAAADLRHLADSIRAETLVVCGDGDIPSFRDDAEWLSQHIERARLAWLAPARHASILEQPGEFVRLLQEFLP